MQLTKVKNCIKFLRSIEIAENKEFKQLTEEVTYLNKQYEDELAKWLSLEFEKKLDKGVMWFDLYPTSSGPFQAFDKRIRKINFRLGQISNFDKPVPRKFSYNDKEYVRKVCEKIAKDENGNDVLNIFVKIRKNLQEVVYYACHVEINDKEIKRIDKVRKLLKDI